MHPTQDVVAQYGLQAQGRDFGRTYIPNAPLTFPPVCRYEPPLLMRFSLQALRLTNAHAL